MVNPRSVAAEDEEDRPDQDDADAEKASDAPEEEPEAEEEPAGEEPTEEPAEPAEESEPQAEPGDEADAAPQHDAEAASDADEPAAPPSDGGSPSEADRDQPASSKPASGSPPMGLIGGALLAVVAGLFIWKSQSNGGGTSPSATASNQGPVAALTSDEATLACPIFAVGPKPAFDAGPLGAAAGSVACETFFAYTGRDFEHHRSPAALMGLDAHASDGPIPYATDHRAKTVEAAKAATGWVDGTVTVGPRDFTVEVRLMIGDAPIGPPGKASHASLQVATSDAAAAAAEAAGLKPVAKLPPALSSLFWSCPDGACFREVMRLGFAIDAAAEPLELCREIVKKHPSAAASLMNNHCAAPMRRAGDEVPSFDKLLASVPEPLRAARLNMAGGADLPASELASKVASAPDAGAKTILRVAESLTRAAASDPEALKVADDIIAKGPRLCLARMVALYASPVREKAKRARAGATWCPEAETFWQSLHGEEQVSAEQNEQAHRIAYALSGRRPNAALDYAQTLLSEVHRDRKALVELKALASRWKDDASAPLIGPYLSARVAQIDGKLGAAEKSLSAAIMAAPKFGHADGSAAALSALTMGFELTGGGEAFTTAFLDRFVLSDPPQLAPDAPVLHLIRLCTYATKDKGLACIGRLRVLSEQGLLKLGGGFPESFAMGAEQYLNGDHASAVETWRADLMDPRVRPHLRPEAFDTEKDPELADSIDQARGRLDGGIVSARHARMARRAAAADKMQLARRFARAVVQALGKADVELNGLEDVQKLAKPSE